MPLKTLVVVTLRLFAIYWLIEAIANLAFSFSILETGFWKWIFALLIGPCCVLFFVVVLWMVASRVSAFVTKGHDVQVAAGALSKSDIYCFAFIWLGLYFALSSISKTTQTGYEFFAFDFPQPVDNPEKGKYLWPFLGHAFTMIAGFACVFGARKWTNKLIRLENKHEAPPPTI